MLDGELCSPARCIIFYWWATHLIKNLSLKLTFPLPFFWRSAPIASALKDYYAWGFLEVSTDILNQLLLNPGGGFTSKTAARHSFSEVKRLLRGRFGSETLKNI